MELLFLGTGGAFTQNNFHNNQILSHNGKRLLIDCGGDIRFSLNKYQIPLSSIDGIYISHFHADHIGGLEYVAFSTFFSSLPRPKLFIASCLVKSLWNSLRGGLQTLDDRSARLSTYFDVCPVDEVFEWNDVLFRLVEVFHVKNNGHFTPSYGLFFDEIFLTTDTRFYSYPLYENARTIFQDCETSPYRSTVHAHYDDLVNLPIDYKAKMYLYHYSDNVDELWYKRATNDGFKGFLIKGQIWTPSYQ